MADLTRSADMLIADVRAAVSRELLESVRPIVRKMIETAEELERALNGSVKPKTVQPGPQSKALRPGPRPKARVPGVPGPRPQTLRRGPKPNAKIAPMVTEGKRSQSPRGLLQTAIGETLQKSKSPLRLSEITNRILETELFRGRARAGINSHIAKWLKAMPEVIKTANKTYIFKNKAGLGQR